MRSKNQAFLNYVEPLWRRLHASARRYVSEGRSQDLVQDTLVRAWGNFSVADERTYSRAWLFVIMRNIAHEWHRAGSRELKFAPQCEVELTEVAAQDLSGPFAVLPAMEERQFCEFLDDRIVEALNGLEPQYREVVILSVAGGLNYREIGEVLDCPIGTVMSRMSRARRELRERLVDYVPARSQTRGGRT